MRLTKKQFFVLVLTGAISLIGIGFYEITPMKIKVKSVNEELVNYKIEGSAKGLIVHKATKEGIWATRGFVIYFKPSDSNSFKKIGRVPISISPAYILKSRVIRRVLNKQEVLELILNQSTKIIAIGGGKIFCSLDMGRSFIEVYNLDHFGYGEGRGIMPQGHTSLDTLNLFWGEYWNNQYRTEVKILESNDGGISWKAGYTFKRGEIAHIHAVQFDPYTQALWMTTGDMDDECRIMYSIDGGNSFSTIGTGSQKWRTCSLIFDEEYVYWGMDGISEQYPHPLIWRWNRKTTETEDLAELDSYAFYSTKLSNGTSFISTDGTDGSACLWQSKDLVNWVSSVCFSKRRKNHFGNIRMTSFDCTLVLSNVNLSPYNDMLLIIKELPE